jgi:hypothetical protein
LNIRKDEPKVPSKRGKFLTKETFWSDKQLSERLSTITHGEKSFIIRMALRDYFGMTDSKKGIVGYKEVDYEGKIISS